MLARGAIDGRPAVANLTDRALTLAVGDDEVWSWDRAGRPYSAWFDGRTRRRGLNGRILEKSRADGVLRRASLDPLSADALVNRGASRARFVLGWEGSDRDLLRVAGRAAAFDARRGREDSARFRELYGEVGILPPDQYLALFTQATEGCSFNTCTFCELYRAPFRVRGRDEFAAHVSAVRAFMGESLSLRGRSIFLGSANALTLPTARLLPLFDVLRETFGALPVGGFVDGFTGSRKSADEYRALAAAGLGRVYVGLESGHDPLLALVRKPGAAADAVDAVRTMKAAGLSVAVIVIVGLGGTRFAGGHVSDTVAVVNALGLDGGDLLYFSEFVEPGDGRYAAAAEAAGTERLDERAVAEQRAAIAGGLTFPRGKPRMARYDLREFVY